MKNLTGRKLSALLAQLPEKHKDLPIYAEYDAGCVHGLYEFDPLTVASDSEDTEFESCVVIPGG